MTDELALPQSLASALLRVATLHSIRGNPKSAEHYTQQAIDFAQDLGSTRLFARALVVRAEIRLHAGNFADASSDLDLVDHVLGEVSPLFAFSGAAYPRSFVQKQTSCPEAIDAQRIRADLLMRDPAVAGAAKDAQAYCLEAQKLLETFVEAAEAGEAGQRFVEPEHVLFFANTLCLPALRSLPRLVGQRSSSLARPFAPPLSAPPRLALRPLPVVTILHRIRSYQRSMPIFCECEVGMLSLFPLGEAADPPLTSRPSSKRESSEQGRRVPDAPETSFQVRHVGRRPGTSFMSTSLFFPLTWRDRRTNSSYSRP